MITSTTCNDECDGHGCEGIMICHVDYDRWYRAPELLVGDTQYGTPVDVWAIGNIIQKENFQRTPVKSQLNLTAVAVLAIGNVIRHQKENVHNDGASAEILIVKIFIDLVA